VQTHRQKLLKAALPALGFPSSFPQAIAQAPPQVLGLGIPALWNQQGIDHVAALLRHGDSPASNVTSCLLRDVMATLRLELGLPGTPFKHSYQHFQLCTTPTYLHTAWEFCNDHAFVVKDNQPNLKLQRVDDQFLMQAFANSGYNKKKPKTAEPVPIMGKSDHLSRYYDWSRHPPHPGSP
jgi:hypothetical protein